MRCHKCPVILASLLGDRCRKEGGSRRNKTTNSTNPTQNSSRNSGLNSDRPIQRGHHFTQNLELDLTSAKLSRVLCEEISAAVNQRRLRIISAQIPVTCRARMRSYSNIRVEIIARFLSWRYVFGAVKCATSREEFPVFFANVSSRRPIERLRTIMKRFSLRGCSEYGGLLG